MQLTQFRLTRQDLRLGSGLILFAYVAAHLTNHALGLISVETAEHGLRVAVAVWQDGKTCVTLGVTPPSKAVGIQDELAIEVTATAKDGSQVERPIKAKLTGDTGIAPKTTRSAPGTFKYTAPGKKGDKGHVAFEQRSKRGVGRAEAEYVVSDILRFDVNATSVLESCRDTVCGSGGSLTGLSVTVELNADGRGTGRGEATLQLNSQTRLIPTGTCSVDSSVQVAMTVTVETVGDTLVVSGRSDPDPTYQSCGVNGPASHASTITIFPSVSVPASGGSGSKTSFDTACINAVGDDGFYRCTLTVTATRVSE